jgi:hypothetical protein
MSVCCECRVLSGRGICDEPITRPEESYRLWCVVVWSGNFKHEEAVASIGRSAKGGKNSIIISVTERCDLQ